MLDSSIVATDDSLYVGLMPADLAAVLASNFRRIRVKYAGTKNGPFTFFDIAP